MAANQGKIFEESLKDSASEQGAFYYRIKDVNPIFLKPNTRVSKNDYDAFIYKHPNLFAVELKSTKSKSISFSESIIKGHQIESLRKASEYKGIVAGFLLNFREDDNYTCFIEINDFLTYKNIAENGLEHTYASKVNKASIPIGICKEIGIEINNVKKKVKYRYLVNKLLDELIIKYT